MPLRISRLNDETWQQCAQRYAERYGLEEEVQMSYEQSIDNGASEAEAALEACIDWDIAEFVPATEGQSDDQS